MAMSGGKDDGSPMMEMNMTPLIDVLLVLLIVFIMSIPVATHAVNIDLPVADPELIPQVHIRADVNTPWRCVAGAIYNVQIAGYPTVGFISNPVDPNG